MPTAASPLQVEQLPIDALHPDPGNPRRIGEDELAALTRSIATFGVVDPVLARRADRRVIAGHQRLVAARRAGLATVPVILLDLTAEDARLLNVALNQIGGEWDADLLARLLIDLRATAARDLTLSGFAEADLQDLLTRFDQREKRDRPERLDLEEPWRRTTGKPPGSPPAPAGGWAPIAFSGATPRTRHSSPAAWAANRRTWSSPTRPTTWPMAPMVGRPPTGPPGACATTPCRSRSGSASAGPGRRA